MTAPDLPAPAGLNSAELSRLSERLGTLLQVGVFLAAIFLVAGVLLTAVATGGSSITPSSYSPSRISWGDLGSAGAGTLLVVVGLVVLVGTPIARVLLSLETFASAHERDYVGILCLVLLILLASVLVGATF